MKTPLARLVAANLFLTVVACAAQPDPSSGQSLAGEWRFALDRADAGVSESWYARELASRDRIQLPGVLQAQGYGNAIATDTPWVVGLGDAWWKLQPAALREKFSQPGHVAVPFLAQPPRHYLGAAWYQRAIEITPAAASGRRVVLFLERPHWETTVWLDERRVGSNNSLVAPHEFDLGALAPGSHRLTVRIDNRQIIRDPQNDGHGVAAHAVSDALGATWNGIAGRLELRSTPLVWLDDIQAFPDVAARSVRLKIKIGNATGQPGSGRLFCLAAGQIVASSLNVTGPLPPPSWDATGGETEVTLALGAGAALWDEFQPHLHRIKVLLDAGVVKDTREVTFGLREITARGHDFLLNGRVVNLRTTHFGLDFPLTGFPATDVESWRRIVRRCQEFGLNGIRFQIGRAHVSTPVT